VAALPSARPSRGRTLFSLSGSAELAAYSPSVFRYADRRRRRRSAFRRGPPRGDRHRATVGSSVASPRRPDCTVLLDCSSERGRAETDRPSVDNGPDARTTPRASDRRRQIRRHLRFGCSDAERYARRCAPPTPRQPLHLYIYIYLPQTSTPSAAFGAGFKRNDRPNDRPSAPNPLERLALSRFSFRRLSPLRASPHVEKIVRAAVDAHPDVRRSVVRGTKAPIRQPSRRPSRLRHPSPTLSSPPLHRSFRPSVCSFVCRHFVDPGRWHDATSSSARLVSLFLSHEIGPGARTQL